MVIFLASQVLLFIFCLCLSSDYGYMHSDGFTGPCVVDDSSSIANPCDGVTGTLVYSRSQGYRKIAGDVCVGGEESKFGTVYDSCIGE